MVDADEISLYSLILTTLSWLYSNSFIILTTFVSYVVIKQLYWEHNVRRKLPPGPIGIPFLGYFPFMTSRPYLKMMELAKTYGGVYG